MTGNNTILEKRTPFDERLKTELEGRVTAGTVFRANEPLARRTTLRVGGSADLFVEPASEADLGQVLNFCHERSLPFFLLGRGSNLLIKDGGIRGVVIWLGHDEFGRIDVQGNTLFCGAGARLKAVAVTAKRNGLAGLEFLEGIPGSVGGALRMNAGAMAGSIFEKVKKVRLMDFQGKVEERLPSELSVTYRSCVTLKTHIALAAWLQAEPGQPDEVQRRMNEFGQKRWKSQPSAPSAGCIFKNPATIPAGKLIDELGLKGTRVGAARVSLEHGNFIVNDGGATARDILELIELIRLRARTERHIELETEVEIIGE